MRLNRKLIQLFALLLALGYYVSATDEGYCNTSSPCSDIAGWGSASREDLLTEVCNIPRRGNITQDEFMREYAHKTPLILENVTSNTYFQELCQKENLLKHYGNRVITLSTANTHSYDKVLIPFSKYLDKILGPQDYNKSGQHTLYFFGNHDYSEWKDLFQHYILPPYTLPNKSPALSFGIAGAGTGVPFHFHGPGFAEVIHGKKRWFLLPYEKKPYFDPDKTTLRWLIENYKDEAKAENIYECVLEPGEIIYFPDKWWHATLNIENSVFMSTFLG